MPSLSPSPLPLHETATSHNPAAEPPTAVATTLPRSASITASVGTCRSDTKDEYVEKGHIGGPRIAALVVDGDANEPVVVIQDFEPDDPENPFNWSQPRKWLNVLVPVYITMLTAINSVSPGIMANWGPEWFHTSRTGFLTNGTAYLLSFAFCSLVSAPLSELFGRLRIYQVSTLIALLFLPQIWTHSIVVLNVVRIFQGAVASAGNALIGGSIAELFAARDRGVVVNLFTLSNFVGQTLAGVPMGWIGMRFGIQWCYAFQGLLLSVAVLGCAFLHETRRDVLLARRARARTAATGVRHMYAGDSDVKTRTVPELIKLSCWRPLQFLLTEPIVTALCTWIAFGWSTIYLSASSAPLVFSQYGWNAGELGSINTTFMLGGLLGLATSFHQERLYARASRRSPTGHAPPEARLPWAVVGAFVFPLATFGYAWTGVPRVPWPVPALFLSIAWAGVSTMYSGVQNYLADAYEVYASSAQAAHGFLRSVGAATFPLFAQALFTGLGYPQASSLVAGIALVLAAAPTLIFVYGARLRARSKVTSALTAGNF